MTPENVQSIFTPFIDQVQSILTTTYPYVLLGLAGLIGLGIALRMFYKHVGGNDTKSFRKTVYIDGVSEWRGKSGKSYIYRDF